MLQVLQTMLIEIDGSFFDDDLVMMVGKKKWPHYSFRTAACLVDKDKQRESLY